MKKKKDGEVRGLGRANESLKCTVVIRPPGCGR